MLDCCMRSALVAASSPPGRIRGAAEPYASPPRNALVLLAISATLTASCLGLCLEHAFAQESVTVEPLPPAPIDTDRVARDLDAAAKRKGTVSVWSFSDRSKAALETPPVPMFLPGEVVADLAGGSQKSAGVLKQAGDGEADTRILNFPDEYFVIRQFGQVRVTVQGSRKEFDAEGGGKRKAARSAPSPDYYSGFNATYSGGQVNFGYAGAHYLVEFECEEGEEGQEAECITEADAERIVKSLALCNTDGRCIDNGTELIRR
jgi:hypothetical protein